MRLPAWRRTARAYKTAARKYRRQLAAASADATAARHALQDAIYEGNRSYNDLAQQHADITGQGVTLLLAADRVLDCVDDNGRIQVGRGVEFAQAISRLRAIVGVG